MLFARGIVLVEGDAEKFLLPVFAASMGHDLDHLGITVCSVAGTNFTPYAKFLTALGIPFSIVTDWDPQGDRTPLGYNRSWRLVKVIEEVRTGEDQDELVQELKDLDDYKEFSERCEAHGVFTNVNTLEIDVFRDEAFTEAVIDTLREQRLSEERQAWVDQWEADPETLDSSNYLKLVEAVGKGRFAQRLASRIQGLEPPAYIAGAITFVVERV